MFFCFFSFFFHVSLGMMNGDIELSSDRASPRRPQLLQPGEAPLETVRNITLNGDVEVRVDWVVLVPAEHTLCLQVPKFGIIAW